MTTEHFALQSARAATIAESTGRATMFLASISGGLIALGLVATASHLGTAFYAFGMVILPTLAFVRLVTFERALQTTMDDHLMARRIALLRGYYLENSPEPPATWSAALRRRTGFVSMDSWAAAANSFGRSPAWSPPSPPSSRAPPRV